MDGWMDESLQAIVRLWVVLMPGWAGLCRTTPKLSAQRRTDGLLSPAGDLSTLPALYLSQHRGSCHDASATPGPRDNRGCPYPHRTLGAGLRPGDGSLSITHEHL